MGCFASGCLIALLVGFFLIVAASASAVGSSINPPSKISPPPVPADVRMEAPSPEVVQKAESSKARLDQAIARNEETTIELTGPELAVLLSRQGDLDFLRDRTAASKSPTPS